MSCSRCLTTSPIETIPTRRPCSTTGTWRNLPLVMRSMMLPMVSLSLHVSTLRVIVWLTGSSSAAARRQRLHNIAFRYDADEAPVGAEDENGADALFRKQLCGSRQVGTWLNRNDLAAFLTKDSADSHYRLPVFHCLFRRHTAGGSEGNITNVRVGAEFRAAGLHCILQCSIEPGGGHEPRSTPTLD